jgi:ABC-type multidrug transport system ATPase subunit
VIELTDVVARTRTRPRVALGPLTLSLDAGMSHALVGTEADGVAVALAVLAGSLPVRSGKLAVFEGAASPGPTVAYAPYVPALPEALTVAAYLELAGQLRGGKAPGTPAERLGVLGCAPLATRRIAHLSFAEARTVALTEALTSGARVLLLAEPLADLDARAPSRVDAALRARVEEGATAVVSTASRADARALCRRLYLIERGKLSSRLSRDEAWAPPLGPRGARLFVRSEGARLLLSELASDPTFTEVQAEGAALVVTGPDPVAMASAVANASRRANVVLDVLSFQATDGDR